MSSELIPNWITLIQHMAEWVYANDFPNWSTLIVEIAIGVGITLYLFYLQSKTDQIRDTVTDQIKKYTKDIDNRLKKYTKDIKEHETIRRKFYIKRIKEILMQIRTYDIELKTFITEYKKAPYHPSVRIQIDLEHRKEELELKCINAERYLEFLEPFLTAPQIAEVMMEYLDKFYEPYADLNKEQNWELSPDLIDYVDKNLDLHIPAIDKYLGLLSKEEEAIDVTNSTNQQSSTSTL